MQTVENANSKICGKKCGKNADQVELPESVRRASLERAKLGQ
jgi:hypothetical protein